MKTVIFKEIKDWTGLPSQGMQIFNPKYRNMDLTSIREQSNIDEEYVPHGYNTFLFNRSTGIIHAYSN